MLMSLMSNTELKLSLISLVVAEYHLCTPVPLLVIATAEPPSVSESLNVSSVFSTTKYEMSSESPAGSVVASRGKIVGRNGEEVGS